MWDEIDPKLKESMEKEYHEELEEYKKNMEAWKKKFNVSEEDVKRKSKKKKD